MNVDLDSAEATAQEEAELQRMRQAIMSRGDKRFWQLVPKRTLFKCLWLALVLAGIVWLQRNTERIAQLFNQSVSPSFSPSSSFPSSSSKTREAP